MLNKEKVCRCPVCWNEKEFSSGGRYFFTYGESTWVCSQECVNIIEDNWGEYFHNFYCSMFKKGNFYDIASEFMSFKDWMIKKPKGDKGIGGFHLNKRHSEDKRAKRH